MDHRELALPFSWRKTFKIIISDFLHKNKFSTQKHIFGLLCLVSKVVFVKTVRVFEQAPNSPKKIDKGFTYYISAIFLWLNK